MLVETPFMWPACDASLLAMVYFPTEAFSAGVQGVDAQLCAEINHELQQNVMSKEFQRCFLYLFFWYIMDFSIKE